MESSGPVEVRDAEGTHAIVEAASRSALGHDGKVALVLEDGQKVLVPGDLLESRDDGSYYVPVRLSDLRQATEGTPEHDEGTIVVPVVQERLNVRKRAVSSTVRVHKTVHETEQVVDEPLVQEDVDIERVAVGREVDAPVPIRYEGDTMVVPLMEEVLVVEKRLMVREELRITRRRTEVRDVRRETLRAEEATVERLPGQPSERQDTSETK